MRIERRESFILPLAGHVEYLGIGIFLENTLRLSSFVLDDNHTIKTIFIYVCNDYIWVSFKLHHISTNLHLRGSVFPNIIPKVRFCKQSASVFLDSTTVLRV